MVHFWSQIWDTNSLMHEEAFRMQKKKKKKKKKILKEIFVWKVGNDNSIKIWGDKWL
jgi:hypothetical protein